MRDDPIVKRPTDAGRRTTGNIPDAVRQSLYQEQLARDIGLPKPGSNQNAGDWEQGRPETLGSLLGQPVAIIMLAVLTFALTLGVLFWRDGAFKGLLASPAKVIEAQSRHWTSDKNPAPIDDPSPATVEEPNEMEAAIQAAEAARQPRPGPQPAAAAPIDETSEDAAQ
jgi:hypothetical protein